MNKKIFLQLFLFLIIIIGSLFFLKKYFFIDDKNTILNEALKNEKSYSSSEESNLIHNIEYVSQDNTGNAFTITSNLGKISNDTPELILMEKVKATIELKNSSPIIIYADNAVYNNINYDTNFYGNV